MIQRIISGGQTGADQGGLLAGRDLGVPTGGIAPWGYMTEDGPAPELLQAFGLVTHHSHMSYPARTKANVLKADATVIFGDSNSPGSRLTFSLCHKCKRPVYVISNPAGMHNADIVGFRAWLFNNKVKTLNVAGNRESRKPDIGEATRRFLVHALSKGDTA